MTLSLRDRFESKVERIPFSTCWYWVGARLPRGYGKLGAPGRRNGWLLAHRVSYDLHKGGVPEGLEVDHLCREPSCVNPDHLEAVTRRENERRKRAAAPPQTSFRCGHPFEEGNWYLLSNGRRYCRHCHLDRCRRRRA